MPISFQPLLSEEDYPGFLTLPATDLPAQFSEWSRIFGDEARQKRAQGFDIPNVSISPAEFMKYCTEAEKRPTMQTLRNFANIKGPSK